MNTVIFYQPARLGLAAEHPVRTGQPRRLSCGCTDAEVRLVNFWSAVQVCVWIATRDERLVARVRPGASLFGEEERIAESNIYSVDLRLAVESAAAGEQKPPEVFDARQAIITAAASGNVVVVGRLRGRGNAVEIAGLAWANLQIRDHSVYGVIAASPDLFDPEADWWDSLRIEQRAVHHQWPFPRVPEARRTGYRMWDDRPDTVAERVWADRRRRLAGGTKPSLELDADGLPHGPEISLVEAWSWCAFGRAIPHTVWVEPRELEDADRKFASSRQSAAYALRQFRRARVDLRELGPRSQSPRDSKYTVDIVHSAAADVASRDLGNVKSAQGHFAKLMGNWRVIEDTYQEFHDRRRVPFVDPQLVHDAAQEAEQTLIRAFLSEDLECLGRFGAEAAQWQPLPLDCFRWPVQIRANHNILETADDASVEQHKAIREHVSVWIDLRVSKSKLKAWHLSRGLAAIPESADSADASADEEILAWAKPIVDRIAAAGRQLRRDQFDAMVEERFARRLSPKASDRLWPVAVPASWRKPSQGRLKEAAKVADWREYENP